MQLYSHKNKYPKPLPDRIYLSNGLTRTDKTTFTAEELLDAGFVVAPEKPVPSFPNKIIDWNGSNWFERDYNEEEKNIMWGIVRERINFLKEEANLLFSQTNNPDLQIYLQELDEVENNNPDPFLINWPFYPVEDPQE